MTAVMEAEGTGQVVRGCLVLPVAGLVVRSYATDLQQFLSVRRSTRSSAMIRLGKSSGHRRAFSIDLATNRFDVVLRLGTLASMYSASIGVETS